VTADWQRVVRFLREHPRSSTQEIRFALHISNVTGRMSDARAHGIEFDKLPDPRNRKVWRYRVVERKPVLRGEQVGMAL
jgi:hypothetical protein